ncbi:MAG: ABC transporter permease [Acidobacteria bacterium]|nr:MAG: ABC transporter permease [Acidobacteriota bacterium]
MIVANVLHRPVRTIISILAVAIEVSMVMLVVGMTTGLLHESAKRVEGVGADVLVQPPGSSFLLGLGSAPVPIKIGGLLAGLQHVQAVTPVLLQTNTTGGLNIIYGIDIKSFERVSGGFAYHSGGAFTGPYDVAVDDPYARANRLKVGDTLSMLDHKFRVCGIVEHGKGARLFIPLETAQDLSGSHDKASIFFVRCTDPGYGDDVVDAIRHLLPDYHVLSVREYMSLMTSNNLPGLKAFIEAMIAIAVGIGFLVIFLSMYTTITERTREIGVLKSLGASKAYIIAAILREAALLCVAGIAAGIIGSVFAKRLILEAFPTLSVDLTADWGIRAAGLALAGSLIGAFYPALRAAQLDPVDALAYE